MSQLNGVVCVGGLPARDSSAEGFSCITPMSFCDLMMSLGCYVNSQNMACVVFVPFGLAAILLAILDSCDRIATPTSGMFLQPLITY